MLSISQEMDHPKLTKMTSMTSSTRIKLPLAENNFQHSRSSNTYSLGKNRISKTITLEKVWCDQVALQTQNRKINLRISIQFHNIATGQVTLEF